LAQGGGKRLAVEILKKFAHGRVCSCRPVTKLTTLDDIRDNASKSAIPSPVGLVNLGHNVSDCASKVRIYLQTGKIHAGYLGMSGDGPVRCQDQQITSQQ
jgi:hypothetical protein